MVGNLYRIAGIGCAALSAHATGVHAAARIADSGRSTVSGHSTVSNRSAASRGAASATAITSAAATPSARGTATPGSGVAGATGSAGTATPIIRMLPKRIVLALIASTTAGPKQGGKSRNSKGNNGYRR
jgi:hypothetical protein